MQQNPKPADGPKSKVRKVSVTEDQSGQRIDNFLRRELPGVPKSRIYRLLRKGEVRVNGGRVRAEYKLQAGDEVPFNIPGLLPPLTDFTPHLVPGAGYSWVDETGYHQSVTSPFPGATWLSQDVVLSQSVSPMVVMPMFMLRGF